jgi:hypothetical protein
MDMKSMDVACFFWTEIDGGLDANVFATNLLSYLETMLKKYPNTKTVSMFSDGCAAQNRNKVCNLF